jgi:hypothetical protein
MEKLWQGTLPTDEPVKLRVGLGSGLKCDGCEVPILPSEPEHEVEMPDGHTLRSHVAWAVAGVEADAAEAVAPRLAADLLLSQEGPTR